MGVDNAFLYWTFEDAVRTPLSTSAKRSECLTEPATCVCSFFWWPVHAGRTQQLQSSKMQSNEKKKARRIRDKKDQLAQRVAESLVVVFFFFDLHVSGSTATWQSCKNHYSEKHHRNREKRRRGERERKRVKEGACAFKTKMSTLHDAITSHLVVRQCKPVSSVRSSDRVVFSETIEVFAVI